VLFRFSNGSAVCLQWYQEVSTPWYLVHRRFVLNLNNLHYINPLVWVADAIYLMIIMYSTFNGWFKFSRIKIVDVNERLVVHSLELWFPY